jgi:hypothetical protein
MRESLPLILLAEAIPAEPVIALADPEFTRTALMRPPLFTSEDREITTGAAWNLFVVKTAAADAPPGA